MTMPPKGYKHSLESRQRMSEAHKGRVFSEEHRAALRKPKSEQHRINAANAKRGIKLKPCTPEERARRSRTSSLRRLQQQSTPQELAMMNTMLALGFKYNEYVSKGKGWPYRVDFINYEYNLIVEIDGSIHKPDHDLRRDQFMISKGYRTIRIKNDEVDTDFESVVSRIKGELWI